ncbi:MAG: hypothetical protein GF387_00865 [Candidatus Portnoybacteria bacterium]|nr:hypothetical protein [Candidatus Portnoybacteria bacterium]
MKEENWFKEFMSFSAMAGVGFYLSVFLFSGTFIFLFLMTYSPNKDILTISPDSRLYEFYASIGIPFIIASIFVLILLNVKFISNEFFVSHKKGAVAMEISRAEKVINIGKSLYGKENIIFLEIENDDYFRLYESCAENNNFKEDDSHIKGVIKIRQKYSSPDQKNPLHPSLLTKLIMPIEISISEISWQNIYEIVVLDAKESNIFLFLYKKISNVLAQNKKRLADIVTEIKRGALTEKALVNEVSEIILSSEGYMGKIKKMGKIRIKISAPMIRACAEETCCDI